MASPEYWGFLAQETNYTQALDYDSSGNQIYVGWTIPGTLKTDTGWRIMQQVYNSSNQLTDILWPNNSTGFNFIWNNRTTYSYGIQSYPAFILFDSAGTRWGITVTSNGNLDSEITPTGPDGAYAPAGIVLQDTSGVLWDLTITTNGTLVTTAGIDPAGAVTSITLTLTGTGVTKWLLSVATNGDLVTNLE